jgi:hypothetical protein
MKTGHLHDVWTSPDNTRLVSKQFSFRLPVHVAAKIAALCEMYPAKNRTQIVADLLTSALDELEDSIPSSRGAFVAMSNEFGDPNDPNAEGLFEIEGVLGRFYKLTDKHYIELEKELGNEKPEPLFGNRCMSESGFKGK